MSLTVDSIRLFEAFHVRNEKKGKMRLASSSKVECFEYIKTIDGNESITVELWIAFFCCDSSKLFSRQFSFMFFPHISVWTGVVVAFLGFTASHTHHSLISAVESKTNRTIIIIFCSVSKFLCTFCVYLIISISCLEFQTLMRSDSRKWV